MKKILLDTDIGSDIDDAVALAYLLANPDCKLLGVTTVSGDVQKRAALVEMILSRSGQSDVPIHCGRREPLLMGPGQPHVPHYEFVKHHPHRLDRPENTAVDFLRQTIRAHPNELTLLSIGPMGNLATLFTVDPEIPFLLAGCVSMAGQFFEGARREWNVIVDPAAAATVARTPRPDHKWVGLDVTLKCKMNAQEVRDRFKSPVLKLVLEMAESWFSHSSELTFHDPLAAALVFHPKLASWKRGKVGVVVHEDEQIAGTTNFASREGSDEVAFSVDRDAFFDEFFRTTVTD